MCGAVCSSSLSAVWEPEDRAKHRPIKSCTDGETCQQEKVAKQLKEFRNGAWEEKQCTS